MLGTHNVYENSWYSVVCKGMVFASTFFMGGQEYSPKTQLFHIVKH